MESDLLKNLKKLKSIGPDADYARQSKMFILAHTQNPVKPRSDFSMFFKLSTVLAVLALTVFSLLRGVFYINTNYSPLALDGLNQNSLTNEAGEINKSIENTLNEINELDQSNRTAINKMDEISKNSDFQVLSMMAAPDNSSSTAIEDVGSFLINATSTSESTEKNDVDSLLEKAIK